MTRIFISVISHNHLDVIRQLNCLPVLAECFEVVIKSNIPEQNKLIEEYCRKFNIHHLNDNYYQGFGKNNNDVYKYCLDFLEMKDDDVFIVLNPDVQIDLDMVELLLTTMNYDNNKIVAINLYKDTDFKYFDNSIRTFPRFIDFLNSFISGVNNTCLDKNSIVNPTKVDWAAGSFIAFKSSHYRFLNGFNEDYFMYCEDIDICYRSNLLGEPVIYYPFIKAYHAACHYNRKILSKHFYWHVKSIIKFLIYKTFNPIEKIR